MESISAELADELSELDPETSANVALAIADWILEEVKADDERLTAALLALNQGHRDHRFRERVWAVVEEMDARAWDLQDAAVGSVRHDEYLAAFARARAANALWCTLATPFTGEMTG